MEKKAIICGTGKNIAGFIPSIIKNITRIKCLFKTYKIIFSMDWSVDGSLELLIDYKKTDPKNIQIIMNGDKPTPTRTINIANGRNKIMDLIKKDYDDYEIMIMMDLDDVCSEPIKMNVLSYFINDKYNEWDSLSFNRKDYYDIWALRYDPYYFNCWGFGTDSRKLVAETKADISKKLSVLKQDEYFEVESAFNGFALYKLEYFKQSKYIGVQSSSIHNKHDKMMMYELYKNMNITWNKDQFDDCEHISFHWYAKLGKPDLKILITPMEIF